MRKQQLPRTTPDYTDTSDVRSLNSEHPMNSKSQNGCRTGQEDINLGCCYQQALRADAGASTGGGPGALNEVVVGHQGRGKQVTREIYTEVEPPTFSKHPELSTATRPAGFH